MAGIQHTDLFSGKTGLVLQRNLIASLSDFGTQISKEFEEETGIPVKCEFVNRAVGAMKIRFKPLIALRTGAMDFERTMDQFIKSRLNYINYYINSAVKAALGKSAIAETSVRDLSGSSSSLWLGDTKGGEKEKKESSGTQWVGVSSG